MMPGIDPHKSEVRAKLERDTQEYLDNGGTITVVPPGQASSEDVYGEVYRDGYRTPLDDE